jgi:hypothetical protein
MLNLLVHPSTQPMLSHRPHSGLRNLSNASAC